MKNNKPIEIPESFKTLVDVIVWRAKENPEQLAIRYLANGEKETAFATYGDLYRRMREIAHQLNEFNSKDRVVLCYPPGIEFISSLLGCFYHGLIPVPVFPVMTEKGIKKLLGISSDCGAKAILTDSGTIKLLHDTPAASDVLKVTKWISTEDSDGQRQSADNSKATLEEVAFLQYTSGSTGNPKGVMVTHQNLVANLRMIIDSTQSHSATRMVSWLPVYHDMGLIGCVLMPLYAGITTCLMPPNAFIEKPIRWLKAIQKYRGSLVTGPNFGYELCIRRVSPAEARELDLSSLEVMINGAEPVRNETLKRFSDHFAVANFRPGSFMPSFGLAEGTLIVSGNPGTQLPETFAVASENRIKQVVSCGRACRGQTVKIVDPEKLVELPEKSIGEIWVSGPNVCKGYWNKTELSESTFQARLANDPHAYLRTGDLGLKKDDALYVTGRIKDLLILNGRNLYPQDIELTVETSHKKIRPGNCVAVSIEGNNGEEVAVVAEVDKSTKPEELPSIREAIVKSVGTEFELGLQHIYLLAPGTLPKTTSGKPQRRLTANLIAKGELKSVGDVSASKHAEAPQENLVAKKAETKVVTSTSGNEIAQQLVKWFAKAAELPPEKVDPEKPLTNYNVDSLIAYEIGSRIEETYGFKVPANLLWEHPTLSAVADYIEKKKLKSAA